MRVRRDWRRLFVLLSQLPRESRLMRALAGDDIEWGITEQLLAATVDALNAANWQRGGGKGPRPKPIPRPGNKPDTQVLGKGTRKRTREELDALLAQHVYGTG